MDTCAWTHVNDVISGADSFFVVLDYNYGITQIS